LEVLSAETLAYLHAAGWDEDRDMETAGYRQALRDMGFRMSAPAREFLARFGELELPHGLVSTGGLGRIGRSRHAPFLVAPDQLAQEFTELDTDGEGDSVVEHWSDVVGSPLCPVAASEVASILIAANGRVFLGFGEGGRLFEVAKSGFAAVEALATDDPNIWNQQRDGEES
jgi:hypothetical protein